MPIVDDQAAAAKMRSAMLRMSRSVPGMLPIYMAARVLQISDPTVTVRAGVNGGSTTIEYNPDFVRGMEPSLLGAIVYMQCLKIALHHVDSRKQEPLELLKLASDIVVAEYAKKLVNVRVGLNMEIVNRLFPSYWNYWGILQKHDFHPETDLVLEKLFGIFKKEFADKRSRPDDSGDAGKNGQRKDDGRESGNAESGSRPTAAHDNADRESGNGSSTGDALRGDDDGGKGEPSNDSAKDNSGGRESTGGKSDDCREGSGPGDAESDGDSADGGTGNQSLDEHRDNGESSAPGSDSDDTGDVDSGSDGEKDNAGTPGAGTPGAGADGANGEGTDGGSVPGGDSASDSDASDGAGGEPGGAGDYSGETDDSDEGGDGHDGGHGEGCADNGCNDPSYSSMSRYFSLTNASSDLKNWREDSIASEQTTTAVLNTLDKGMYDHTRGTLPVMLRNACKVKVNKEAMFKKFMASIVDDEPVSSWGRRNRKYLRFGTIAPGVIYDEVQHILLCADVSGSMFQAEAINKCLTVMESVIDGLSVDIVYWNSVCSPVFSSPRTITDMAVYGGGMTDPDCVLRKLGPDRFKYDGLIFLTDCIFKWDEPPKSRQIMILRTHGSHAFPEWCRYTDDLDSFVGN